ncbi:MAG: diguanylate cyclase, partial [Actinomycetota bacterium]|nr:diguanylate cyclase [Actinomycetota bacterium]
VRKDGKTVWVRPTVSAVRNENGEPSFLVGMVEDVTERKALEDSLAYRATHDSLTGLPNRSLLMERLGQALSRARRKGWRVALLFLDLDNFKVVNDSLGHEAGDRLLLAVAERLKGAVRPEDTVARLGGGRVRGADRGGRPRRGVPGGGEDLRGPRGSFRPRRHPPRRGGGRGGRSRGGDRP